MRADVSLLVRIVRLLVQRGNLTPRYVVTAGATMLAWFVFYASVRVWQGLDRLLAPQFRRSSLAPPVFIVASPRSGTTFLHRLMSMDDQFRSLALYETVLPSGLLLRLVRRIARIDAAVGRPVGRLLAALERLLFGGWKGIHHVSFSQPEEDEMLFLYALRSPALMLLHPALGELTEVRRPDDLPDVELARLEADLRDALLRQAWAAEDARPLLGKNALSAGRLNLYRRVAPDLRLVRLVRHPYEAIPSMVSMFSRPWRLFRPAWEKDPELLRRVAELGCEIYRGLDDFAASMPREQVFELTYDDLVADPEAAVREIYAHFGLEISPEFARRLREETAKARRYRSQHHYDLASMGLSHAWIQEQLGDVFERRDFAA